MAEAGYETFVRRIEDIKVGEPNVLVLRDLFPGRRKYFAQNAVAVVTRTPDADGQSRPLRIRSMVGNLFPGDWYVAITELLPSRVPGAPYSSAFDAMHEAWGDRAASARAG